MVSDSSGPNQIDLLSANPVALDRYLRDKFRSRRLVGEYPFEGPEFERAKHLVGQIPSMDMKIRQFARVHPALYVYYLAGTGAHLGDGGELWTFVTFASKHETAAGESFEDAIKQLGFADVWPRMQRERPRPMRYVAQVMFHAIVPKDSARGTP